MRTESEILQEIREISPLLASLHGKKTFAVPDKYFDNLTEQLAERSINSGLYVNSQKIATPQETPAGYFEGLSGFIRSNIDQTEKARVVPLYKKPFFRYAVAAAVVSVLFLTIFFNLRPTAPLDSFAVINKHTVTSKTALQYHTEKAFDLGIASLSDQQIIAYLEDYGDISAGSQLLQDADTAGMPDPLEYLTDDDALKNYLHKIFTSSNPVEKQ